MSNEKEDAISTVGGLATAGAVAGIAIASAAGVALAPVVGIAAGITCLSYGIIKAFKKD